MVRQLHEMDFSVLLWVTPFVNRESVNFPALARDGFLVRRKGSIEPSLLKWWGGTAGFIDLTNPDAKEWFKGRLNQLKTEVGVDGFKIDGGDAKYQPPTEDAEWYSYGGPSGYSDELLSLFEELAPGRCETRTVWMSQKRAILWRQGGKDSHWGIDNGLKALVTYGMQMSLLGYDVSIPDMIPGRVQTMSSDDPLPTDELMVRWTEVSAFFPIMQFSYLPWNYSPETNEVVKNYAKLHRAIADYVYGQANDRSSPLLRPLWYDHPKSRELYTVADEFMLGSDLLVAPVLDENHVARDVFLPPGQWRDAWSGEVYGKASSGTRRRHDTLSLLQHPAPLPGIPLFVRAENTELFEKLHAELKQIRRGSVPMGVTTTNYHCGVNRDLKVTG
jgi:alpha-glucosidase (family GH31 glycosyl hydrolase)